MMDWVRNADKDEAEAKDDLERRIAKGLNFKIFFVSIDRNDPTEEFLKRLQDVPRIVKKGSAGEVAENVMRMPVVDKESGMRGIVFRADKIVWKGRGNVTVEGGYHCDGLCAAGYTFDLRLENGKWSVKKKRLDSVS